MTLSSIETMRWHSAGKSALAASVGHRILTHPDTSVTGPAHAQVLIRPVHARMD